VIILKIFKKILKTIIKILLPIFIKVDNNKIIILDETPLSGSNTGTFYNYLVNFKNYRNVEMYQATSIPKNLNEFKQYFKYLKTLFKAKIIIVDHSMPEVSKKQVIIQLWHGIPLKSMALMDKSELYDANKSSLKNANVFCSTSDFSTILLNSCFGLDGCKYKILGSQRNDLLFLKDKKIIEDLMNHDISDKKLIIYMPTFKKGYIKRNEGFKKDKNMFAFENFDLAELDKFLEKNNFIMIVKLHPFEEKFYIEKLNKNNTKNIFITDINYLKRKKIDIYRFLAISDLLITDYSSVYLDYLLIQKPILFNKVDIEEYKEVRGILLEPYDFWTPGPKVCNQKELQAEIIKLLSNENYYSSERTMLLNMFHKYKDGNSCERTWELIYNNYLKRN
jgi:CDP-glycerol glycerophosphotransferase (TagB/SpsB family)